MNPDGDAYTLMRGRVFTSYDDVLALEAPLRWIYVDRLKKDIEAERAAIQTAAATKP